MPDQQPAFVEEPAGYASRPGFVKSRPENNQNYVDQFAGDPWEPAIRRTAERLQELSPRVNISQIKEKFGELRFYYDIPDGIRPDEMAAEFGGDVDKLRVAVDKAIAWAVGWCAGYDAAGVGGGA